MGSPGRLTRPTVHTGRMAMGPALVSYGTANPQVLWQAGRATGLFIAAFGTVGYAARRDLSGLARMCVRPGCGWPGRSCR